MYHQHLLFPLLSYHIPLFIVAKLNSLCLLFIIFIVALNFYFGSNKKERSLGVYVFFKMQKTFTGILLWSMIQTPIIVYCVSKMLNIIL